MSTIAGFRIRPISIDRLGRDAVQMLGVAGASGLATFIVLRACMLEQHPQLLTAPSFWLGTMAVVGIFTALLSLRDPA